MTLALGSPDSGTRVGQVKTASCTGGDGLRGRPSQARTWKSGDVAAEEGSAPRRPVAGRAKTPSHDAPTVTVPVTGEVERGEGHRA